MSIYIFMFVSAESLENIEKLSNDNDSKTILQHHVSISTYLLLICYYVGRVNLSLFMIISNYRSKLIDYLV